MNVIILLGAPGAGKGTAAEAIKAATDYQHVSTGDMLRDAVKRGTDLGRQADAYMKRGALVPDDLIMQLIEARISASPSDVKLMFDGFPRTLEQAEALDRVLGRHGAQVHRVFDLDTDRAVLIERLTGRRICRKCGANYHIRNIPPRQAGVCDVCGGELYQRPDDREETIANRLDVFARQTRPLIDYYDRKGVRVRVDAGKHRRDTLADILAQL